MIGKISIFAFTFVSFLAGGLVPQAGAVEGDELIGTKPPEWKVRGWFNSAPLRLEDLRGKVALVRFWTGPECPYCRASAPALNEFYQKYHGQGLEVIGIYHHKSSAPLDEESVRNLAKEYGFQFPVAIDDGWRTLNRWWLEGRPLYSPRRRVHKGRRGLCGAERPDREAPPRIKK